MVVDKALHFFGKPVIAPAGKGQHGLRRFKALSGGKTYPQLGGGYALHHPGKSLGGAPHAGVMVAGVDKIEAVYPAVILPRAVFGKEEARVVAV